MVQRVVEQVDQQAPQVIGVEADVGRGRVGVHPEHALGLVLPDPFVRDLPHRVVQRQHRRGGIVLGGLDTRDVEDVVHDAREPLGVLLDHACEPLLPGFHHLFVEQRVGLGDGRQWVADFVCHGR
ncbi:hypothetical protein FQZ97_803850 [compost metagenome]